MNLLVFEPNELSEQHLLKVEGERAHYLIYVQRVAAGDILRVGELGGQMGSGVVRQLTKDSVLVELGPLTQPSPLARLDLIVAMPRPQTLKKVLQTAATMGVGTLMLVRSERVEKSYFSSPLLGHEQLRKHLQLGLEQGISTILPEVLIYKRFMDFVDKELSAMHKSDAQLLLGHPAAERELAALGLEQSIGPEDRVVLAIGPEGGWRVHEVQQFEKNGFTAFSCGKRVLRVETAVASLLGQIDLLRQLQ